MLKFNVTLEFDVYDIERFYNVMTVYRSPVVSPTVEIAEMVKNEEVPAPEIAKLITDIAAELDSHDVPWSDTFHSAARSKNADGTWRRKRGVNKDAADEYEAYYYTAPAGSVVPTGNVTGWDNPVITFDDVNKLAGKLIGEGKIDGDELKRICNEEGIYAPGVELPKNPDACVAIYHELIKIQ